jgi:hypothetical protein
MSASPSLPIVPMMTDVSPAARAPSPRLFDVEIEL